MAASFGIGHSTSSRVLDHPNSVIQPDRPCDECCKRMTRCVIESEATSCVMCNYHKQACTFAGDATPRKRKQPVPDSGIRSKKISTEGGALRRVLVSGSEIGTGIVIDDYANVHGESLLKKTLGLQNHRYAKYIGATDEHDVALLDLRLYDDVNESASDQGSFRKVAPGVFFRQAADDEAPTFPEDVIACDAIERLVAPYGRALVDLYFTVVHPSFPILHKKVYLEKYGRSHREFSPPLLAAVYILALNWWTYAPELARATKPNVPELENIAFRTLQNTAQRAKLSTVQAGLILLQRMTGYSSWQLTTQLVAIGQDLGLHLDCTNWRIPIWERGLRKRLAWALYCQDTWSALIYGRPPHISSPNWGVRNIESSDFLEDGIDEDPEEDSTEVEKGRTLFSALITLTKMLGEVLENLYSARADSEIRSSDATKSVLGKAKPIQLRLRSWYSEMPEVLRMDNTKPGKLSSVGYLHLAYFATEITLHRRILRTLSANTDPYLTQIVRSAAKARLISAMDFFNRLKPEHLQSFWYFASKFNFALIGTFAGLCFVTSVSQDEAEFYQRRLQEYRWTLRVSNKSAEFLEIASGILESAVGVLLKAAEGIEARRLEFPMSYGGEEEAEDNELDEYLAGMAPVDDGEAETTGYYDTTMENVER